MSDIWEEIEGQKRLTPTIRERIRQAYGTRGENALRIVDGHRVKKYLDFFVVVGKNDEYVVDEEFCTCDDFRYRGGRCSHILAQKIALLTGDYEPVDLWYQEYLRDAPGDDNTNDRPGTN
jgi:predicted nucleic acid-binding Zn finger protein